MGFPRNLDGFSSFIKALQWIVSCGSGSGRHSERSSTSWRGYVDDPGLDHERILATAFSSGYVGSFRLQSKMASPIPLTPTGLYIEGSSGEFRDWKICSFMFKIERAEELLTRQRADLHTSTFLPCHSSNFARY